jgi:hypothetical protein
MIMPKKLPDVQLLSELLSYDPNTGLFCWKPRLPKHFISTPHRSTEWQCKWWNTRFANTEAGSFDPGGYKLIRINSIDYRAHRLAWLIIHGTTPEFIDHINGIRDDNRIVNLRSVNHEANTQNAKRRRDNITGTVGVSYYASKGTWRARINKAGKTILLGYFRTKEEAIAARKAAERMYEYHENHGR